jgi:Predicted transcriptional regulators containing the CopG/Arc/MetJ DNA-binding domain and a metal-binding domain
MELKKKVYLNIPVELLKEVDGFVGRGKGYLTRTEMIRDAVRRRVAELESAERTLALDSAGKGGLRSPRAKLVEALDEYLRETKEEVSQ